MTHETSMGRFEALFNGAAKPVIAMAHVPALPGTPLYDGRGMPAIVDHVLRDVQILEEAGFGGILFCNENDRPYELVGGPESAAMLARVVTECRPTSLPYGVDFLWDARIALAVGVATGAGFIREVITGVWESDMGMWRPDAARTLRERRRLGADDMAVFMNITPEFASPIGVRSPAEAARSIAVSSIPDAILVSGPMAGASPELTLVSEVRAAVPTEIPVLLNTGARAETIAEFLGVADGCIVGTSLKVDGHTWNAVDPVRARRFVEAATG